MNATLLCLQQVLEPNKEDMGFFGSIISSAVKVALTPVAVVKDAVDVVRGEEPTTTKDLIESAGDDVEGAFGM